MNEANYYLCAIPAIRVDLYLMEAIESLFRNIDSGVVKFYIHFDQSSHPGEINPFWLNLEIYLLNSDAWLDGRLTLSSSLKPLGLIGNWNLTAQYAREEYRDSKFFFWGSDHDLWDKKFISEHINLRNFPALWVPTSADYYNEQNIKPLYSKKVARSSPFGKYPPGYAIYGIFDLSQVTLPQLPHHLLPDKLFITLFARNFRIENSESEQFLYLRRRLPNEEFSIQRQRRKLWSSDNIPFSSKFPWWISHLIVLNTMVFLEPRRFLEKSYREWFCFSCTDLLKRISVLRETRNLIRKLAGMMKAIFR